MSCIFAESACPHNLDSHRFTLMAKHRIYWTCHFRQKLKFPQQAIHFLMDFYSICDHSCLSIFLGLGKVNPRSMIVIIVSNTTFCDLYALEFFIQVQLVVADLLCSTFQVMIQEFANGVRLQYQKWELSTTGVQGPLKDNGSFWIFNARIYSHSLYIPFFSHLCNLGGYSVFGRIPVGVKIKVHNVFYTHTSIYSKLILSTDGSKYR